MSDQTSPVAAGTLSGINLSGEEGAPEAALPAEDDRTLTEAASEASEPTTPSDEPPAAPEPPVEEPVEPPAPAEEPEPEPSAAAAKKTGAPARPYVVLKEDKFDDESSYYTLVHEVQARNAQNAMRQAFKDLIGGNDNVAEATLVVIPKSMFRPTPVKLNKTERVSVSFG